MLGAFLLIDQQFDQQREIKAREFDITGTISSMSKN
jgi:hypothetical protein